jgi:HEAT repeat protein
MNKSLILLVITCSIAAGLHHVYRAGHRGEVLYKGKTLSYWIEALEEEKPELASNESSSKQVAEAAIRDIGTNAFALLKTMICAKDGNWKRTVSEYLIDSGITGIRLKLPSDNRRRAFKAFEVIGPSSIGTLIPLLQDRYACPEASALLIGYGTNAVVPLLACARNKDKSIRLEALNILGAIHENPDHVVPVLTEGLRDFAPEVRVVCARSLGYYGRYARESIPCLREASTKDESNEVRKWADDSLGRIQTAVDRESFR